MIGFNGGLIGKSNNNTGFDSQPGVWTPLEQIKSRREGTWPLSAGDVPSGYKLGMNFDASNGGRLFASTWTLTSTNTPKTYVSTGGVDNSGYFSNTGRAVNSDFYRITEAGLLDASAWTYAIWYKGTQNFANSTYNPGVALFGDIRGSVYGGLGINSDKASFVDTGNNYNSVTSVNTGNWVHIVFTISLTNQLKIYVNGALDATHNSISINSSYTRCTDIGAAYTGNAPSAIDGVFVYDRVLTDAEVLRLYGAGNVA
jgi:hypothetical protein